MTLNVQEIKKIITQNREKNARFWDSQLGRWLDYWNSLLDEKRFGDDFFCYACHPGIPWGTPVSDHLNESFDPSGSVFENQCGTLHFGFIAANRTGLDQWVYDGCKLGCLTIAPDFLELPNSVFQNGCLRHDPIANVFSRMESNGNWAPFKFQETQFLEDLWEQAWLGFIQNDSPQFD